MYESLKMEFLVHVWKKKNRGHGLFSFRKPVISLLWLFCVLLNTQSYLKLKVGFRVVAGHEKCTGTGHCDEQKTGIQ